MVIRILDSIRGVRLLKDLGFSELQMKQIRTALGAPYGMVLISGPTGSGKSTVLPTELYLRFNKTLRKSIIVTQPKILTTISIPKNKLSAAEE